MKICQGHMHTKEIPILLRAHLWGIVNDPNMYFNTITIEIVGDFLNLKQFLGEKGFIF